MCTLVNKLILWWIQFAFGHSFVTRFILHLFTNSFFNSLISSFIQSLLHLFFRFREAVETVAPFHPCPPTCWGPRRTRSSSCRDRNPNFPESYQILGAESEIWFPNRPDRLEVAAAEAFPAKTDQVKKSLLLEIIKF